MSMQTIEQLTKQYADARALLAERVRTLTDEVNDAKRRKLPGIKSALSTSKDLQTQLLALIGGNTKLFDKPRSRVFHGIKVGLQKAKGKVAFDSDEQVVKLIRKHLADQFDVLVKTTEKPSKDALLNLPASNLKLIGCRLIETGDAAFAKTIDGEIDKLVDALLETDKDENSDA
jgi:hypothetical protein